MSPVLIGRAHARGEQTKPVAYRGPPKLIDRLDKAAKDLNLSRNETITQLLAFALAEHEREEARKAKKK